MATVGILRDLFRIKKQSNPATISSPATPPTTPPIISPVFANEGELLGLGSDTALRLADIVDLVGVLDNVEDVVGMGVDVDIEVAAIVMSV